MKTRMEIEAKRLRLVDAIIKKQKEIDATAHPTGADYLELQTMEEQLKAIKWVLS